MNRQGVYKLAPLYKEFLDKYEGKISSIMAEEIWNWINQNYISKEQINNLNKNETIQNKK